MVTEKVRYRDWEFEIDTIQTKAFYKNIDMGGAESCTCGNCKYFITVRDKIFPEEIKDLFKTFNIDFTKDYDVCDYGTDEVDHIYNGWFYFIGKLIKGKDCCIPLPDGNGCTLELTPINEKFQIGFSRKTSEAHFENHNDLVEISFFADMQNIT